MTVYAYKHTDILHCEWKGELICQNDEYVVLRCQPNRPFIHHTKGKTFLMSHESLEVFSLKDGFNAALTVEDGEITAYYVNVAQPCVVNENAISYVDLDFDMVKRKGKEWKVVDEDEFLENQLTYHYPPDLIEYAMNELDALKTRIETNQFPFHSTIEQDILCVMEEPLT